MNNRSEFQDRAIENVDAKLRSQSQTRVEAVVKQLPADTVNMVWRSDLNQKLQAVVAQKARKRRIWNWSLASGFGMATACAVFAVMMIKTVPTASPVTGDVTATIADLHQKSEVLDSLSGTGDAVLTVASNTPNSVTANPKGSESLDEAFDNDWIENSIY